MNTLFNTSNNSITQNIQNASVTQNLKLGTFQPYDSQVPVPEFAETRIVKCLYQISSKSGERVRENVFVRIPTSHITEDLICNEITKLAPYVLTFLQDQEDLIVKAAHKNDETRIFTEYLTLAKVIEALELKEAGARLNKEKIELWFEAEIMSSLAELFASKLGLALDSEESQDDEKVAKLEMILNAYKIKFCSLASGKTFVKEQDCESMIEIIRKCEAQNSSIGSRFIAKLESMKMKKEDLLLAL